MVDTVPSPKFHDHDPGGPAQCEVSVDVDVSVDPRVLQAEITGDVYVAVDVSLSVPERKTPIDVYLPGFSRRPEAGAPAVEGNVAVDVDVRHVDGGTTVEVARIQISSNNDRCTRAVDIIPTE